jgi:hypothetical protein
VITETQGRDDDTLIECMFCGLSNKASREHVLPQWVKRRDETRRDRVRLGVSDIRR